MEDKKMATVDGVDRLRFDDKDGRGTYYCNQCGAGDGFDLAKKYHMVACGDFPAPVKLGPRASAWVESEIHSWVDSRIQTRQASEALT